ncbi:MAG: low molecular weight protein-tyrosine-phosphatase [Qingshengfaniella sp.]
MNTHPISVLFVCLGNICRSPAAEAVMRALAPQWHLDSAGTGGWHVGEPPHPPMIAAAAARGYDMARLRARQVETADFRRFDHLIAMDTENLKHLRQICPADATARLGLLLDHLPDTKGQAVPDPYYTGDFIGALTLIEAGCRALLHDLSPP